MVNTLKVSLFGKFDVEYGETKVQQSIAGKAQELFMYLLINRDKFISREILADVLWQGYGTTSQTKKYLRKAIWQLQSTLNSCKNLVVPQLIQVDAEWIKLQSCELLDLDIAFFESVYLKFEGIHGRELNAADAESIEQAVERYRGGLLETFYQEWCLTERERFEHMYLSLLDKLVAYYGAAGRYERGIRCGQRILRIDKARERTHRQLMKLFFQAGDRTGSLRQFQLCTKYLKEELDVDPSAQTVQLYNHLQGQNLELENEDLSTLRFLPAEEKAIDNADQLFSLQQELMTIRIRAEQALRMINSMLGPG